MNHARSWWSWAGIGLVVVAFTVVPQIVKQAHLPGPGWLSPTLVALAGAVVVVVKPLLTARGDVGAARVKAAAERSSRAADAMAGLPRMGKRLPLVKAVTDRVLLDIHEAFPLPPDHIAPGLSADLPTYVLRDVDADLQTFLAVSKERGGFALLVGPAAVGKTRTAYEAIRRVLPEWRMLIPDNGNVINELVSDPRRDLGRSVIWLNETQNFLTSDKAIVAANVRRLLMNKRRPVILIGTIWPDTFDQLRAKRHAPAIGSTDEADATRSVGAVEDINRNSRDVLGLARRFDLTGFSTAEWNRARESADADPRLEAAVTYAGKSADGLGLPQILAAAPELIRRWEQADNPYGKAVLTAAVTARRCGHPPTIPTPVLRVLGEHFLSGTDRATAPATWFDDALTWATASVHDSGTIAPLFPDGRSAGRTDGYRVSDILTDHTALTSPAPTLPDAPVWDLLITTAAPSACHGITTRAHKFGLTVQARTAATRAAKSGNTDAMYTLGLLLEEDGEAQQARTWYMRAAVADHTDAMACLSILLEEAGEVDQARTWWTRALQRAVVGEVEQTRVWYTRAAEAGHSSAMYKLGLLIEEAEGGEQARVWYTRAAEQGHTDAMYKLGLLLERTEEVEQARVWYVRVAEQGHTDAMYRLGLILEEAEGSEQARLWYTRAAEAGHTSAMYDLGVLLKTAGEAEQARLWYTHAAAAGHSSAMYKLGLIHEEMEEVEQARLWYTRAAENSHGRAMVNLGVLLKAAGEVEQARLWYTRAAEDGDAKAMYNLGLLLAETDAADEARAWYTRAATAGHTSGMVCLGVLLEAAGEVEQARVWHTRAAEDGNASAMACLSALLEATGEPDQASVWSIRAAAASRTTAGADPSAPADEAGGAGRAWWVSGQPRYDPVKARVLRTHAVLGDADAMFQLGRLLAEAGEDDRACAWYTRAIELDPGRTRAISHRGMVYGLMGRNEEAMADFNRAVELDPDDDWVLTWRGSIHRIMGRYDEALADLNRSIELGPDNFWARHECAMVLSLLGLDGARDQWCKAKDALMALAEGGDPYALDRRYGLVVVLCGLGEWKEAAEQLESLLTASPGPHVVAELLTDLTELAGTVPVDHVRLRPLLGRMEVAVKELG